MAEIKKNASNSYKKIYTLFFGGTAVGLVITLGAEYYFDPNHEVPFGKIPQFIAGVFLGGLSAVAASLFVASYKNWASHKRDIHVGNEETIEVDQKASQIGDVLLYFSILGGILGMATAVWKIIEYFKTKPRLWLLEFVIPPAFAADGVKTELASIIPYVAIGVLGLMGVSFLLALGTILLLADTKENQARIKAADNIVKTFGGFFTGLATTLIH
jgi:hypothetical protein